MQVYLTEVVRGRSSQIVAMGQPSRCELLIFINSLQRDNPREASKVAALLRKVAESGMPRNPEKCRFFKGYGLFEFKTAGGVRIMAFWDKDHLIVCTHGFLKKSQKTPKEQLDRAKRSMKQYFSAKERGLVAFA